MQTIIGSGGAIGTPLARALKEFTNEIRLVSRHPRKVNEGDQLYIMDATDLSLIDKAVAGSEIVYITIGFPYKLKVWRNNWPPFMDAVIKACIKHHAKLVFFDNMYLYSKAALPHMTEESTIAPPSRKGSIRAQVYRMIMDAVEKEKITALIARSADFYGPNLKNSIIGEMVVKTLAAGKKAQAFGNLHKIHTYTYTPDAGKATALLGNSGDAYNQVWHVPTTKERLTNKQWIGLIAEAMNTTARIQVVPKWMVHALGIFIPVMREFPEMIYQNEEDYVFDSTKFEKRFGILATPPREGIKEMVREISNDTR